MAHLLSAPSGFGQTLHDSLAISIDLDRNGLAKPSADTAKAFRHATGLLLPTDGLQPLTPETYDDSLRSYVKGLRAADPSGIQARIFLTYWSSFFHELRHAHDLMGTAYGQDVLYSLSRGYVSLPGLLSSLTEWQRSNPQSPIPVPLHKYVDDLKGLNPDAVSLVKRYAEQVLNLRSYHEPATASYSGLGVIHLLEASATSTQLGTVNEIFGGYATFELATLISSGANMPLYLESINETRDILISRGEQAHEVSASINYLVWASLMAICPVHGKLSDALMPPVAFEALVEYLSRRKGEWKLSWVKEGVTEFCASWGLDAPEQMSGRYQQKMTERLARFETQPGTKPYVAWYRVFQSWFDQLQANIKLEDVYFRSQTYPWMVLRGTLPSVLVRMRFEGERHDFMSSGVQNTAHSEWVDRNLQAVLMRVIVMGLGTTGDPDAEQFLLRHLTNEGWVDGHKLRFKDKSLFD